MDQGLSIAQEFSGLPMKSLIGGPLIAAAQANAQMAFTQTEFMLNTCFTQSGGTGGAPVNYEPIMIQMTLARAVLQPADPNDPKSVPSIQNFNTTFNLPLLTIIPLNSLAVTEAEVTFEMNVQNSSSSDDKSQKSADFSAKGGFSGSAGIGPFSVHISGSVSYDHKDSSSHDTHYESKNSAKYTVNCKAGQLPLPKGVNVILDAFAKSINPIEMPKQVPAPTSGTKKP